MRRAFSIDPNQALAEADELDLVRLGASLGYESAWTPAGPDEKAFDRCLRWHRASGLPTGIAVVPASGRPAAFYAEHARRTWEETGWRFQFGVGSGSMAKAAAGMRSYLEELRRLLPAGQPIYLAALGPLMLRLGGELADGVSLNWCSPDQVAGSRRIVEEAAAEARRPVPEIVEYVRTAVDPDPELARQTLAEAMKPYALGSPAYRAHFGRMGFEAELRRMEEGAPASAELLAAAGAAGAPGEVRSQFERAAAGLDVAIVRVLVTRRGDAASARRVLEECAPRP